MVAAGAALTAAFFLLPAALVFPVTSCALVVAAVTFALIAWTSPPDVNRLVFWDTAGVMTVLGLTAALLGEPEQAVALLERDR